MGGRWSSSTDSWSDVICPSTEEVAARVRASSTTDIDQAVTAARRALATGDWAQRPFADRAEVVRRAADLVDPQAEEIGHLITTEMGAPLALFQVVAATHYMRSLADASDTLTLGEARPGWLAWALVEREPVGVVGSLAPWNGPFHLAAQKSIAALLAGCSVVFRPAAETPLDAFYLAEALIEAGLPDGVLSVIPGGTEIGQYLVAHPGVDMVDFTGSTAAGRQIGATCGQQLKRVHLELGGKSAAVVLDDADVEQILPALGQVFMNSGQVCAALTRVLAPTSMYDDVVDGLASVASSLHVGDPFDQTTEMGPLVSKRQLDRVKGYITRGEEEGAEVAFGGGTPAGLDCGFYVQPTVFSGVRNDMTIAREEIFGPVVCVIPYGDLDEAVAIANDTPYGLHGGVFTADPTRGVDVARRLETGTVSVNSFTINTDAPFGGRKCSGIGRENGPEGIGAFLEYKTINVAEDVARSYTSGAPVA